MITNNLGLYECIITYIYYKFKVVHIIVFNVKNYFYL